MKVCTAAWRDKLPTITKSQAISFVRNGLRKEKDRLFPQADLANLTPRASGHAEKIPLADFDAIMPQNAVGGRGVEIEIRKRKAVEEFLTLQRQGFIGADGEGYFAAVR